MTVQDVPYSTMQDAHCPDACVEPHGRVYASRLFTLQHLTTTEPIIYAVVLSKLTIVQQFQVALIMKRAQGFMLVLGYQMLTGLMA